jgi:hypothetical protein
MMEHDLVRNDEDGPIADKTPHKHWKKSHSLPDFSATGADYDNCAMQ